MAHSRSPLHDGPDACAGCAAQSTRRQFLRDAALMAAGAVAALGVAPSQAAAFPVRFVSALGATGTEKTYALPPADGVNIDKQESVIIARSQNVVYAFSLACPHQQTALKWDEMDKEFKCPKHFSTFHADGVYVPDSGRATRGMDRFAVRKDGANVAVDLEKLYQEDEDAAQWKAALIQL
jgi:nitrite reductase/ring-hydroxylating ferredoxin subunit